MGLLGVEKTSGHRQIFNGNQVLHGYDFFNGVGVVLFHGGLLFFGYTALVTKSQIKFTQFYFLHIYFSFVYCIQI